MVVFVLLSVVFSGAGHFVEAGLTLGDLLNQETRAIAILEAVAEARAGVKCISCEVDMEYGDGKLVRKLSIKQDGTRMFLVERVFVEGKPVEVSRMLRLNAEFFKFSEGAAQADVYSFDERKSAESFFSPTILGVGTALIPKAELRPSLGLGGNGEPPSIDASVSDEPGVVRIKKNNGLVKMLFRVRLKELQVLTVEAEHSAGGISVNVNSVYTPGEIIPTGCSILKNRDGKLEKTTVRLSKMSNVCREEDFRLENLDIPVGTPLCDNRISRYVGNWNGKAFVSDMEPGQFTVAKNGAWKGYGVWGVSLLVVSFVALLVFFRVRKGAGRSV